MQTICNLLTHVQYHVIMYIGRGMWDSLAADVSPCLHMHCFMAHVYG